LKAAAVPTTLTRVYDFTEYVDTAPVSELDPVLWLEADRLKSLDFAPEHLENQRKVVEEEVRVNVAERALRPLLRHRPSRQSV